MLVLVVALAADVARWVGVRRWVAGRRWAGQACRGPAGAHGGAGAGGGAAGAGQGGHPGRRGHRAGAVRAQCRPAQAMASTTKVMTALLALERLDERRVVTIGAGPPQVGEESLRLRQGERLTVRQLLLGLMLKSANDAGVALAEAVDGSEAAFVRRMNRARPSASGDPLRDPLRPRPARPPDQRPRPGPPLGGGHAPGRLPLHRRHQGGQAARWPVVASSICHHEPAARLTGGRSGARPVHQPGRTLPGRLGQPGRPPPGRGGARLAQRLPGRAGPVRLWLLQVRPGPPGPARPAGVGGPGRPAASRPTPTRTPWSAWTSSTRSASPSFRVGLRWRRNGRGERGAGRRHGLVHERGPAPGQGPAGPAPGRCRRIGRDPHRGCRRPGRTGPTRSSTPGHQPLPPPRPRARPQDPALAGEERPVVRLLVDREAVQGAGGELGAELRAYQGWSRSWCRCCGRGGVPGRPGAGGGDAVPGGLHGHLALRRLRGHRGGPDREGPRPGPVRRPRAGGGGHRRHRPDPDLPAPGPGRPRAGQPAGLRPAGQARPAHRRRPPVVCGLRGPGRVPGRVRAGPGRARAGPGRAAGRRRPGGGARRPGPARPSDQARWRDGRLGRAGSRLQPSLGMSHRLGASDSLGQCGKRPAGRQERSTPEGVSRWSN